MNAGRSVSPRTTGAESRPAWSITTPAPETLLSEPPRCALDERLAGDEYVRGVNAAEVLSCFGRHLASKPIQGCWHLSREVRCIDLFLAHSWCMGRKMKYVSLCLELNGRLAVALGYFTCVLVFSLDRFLPSCGHRWSASKEKEVEFKMWCSLLGLTTCAFFLFYGQRVRETLGYREGYLPGLKPCVLFFDRLCIPQDDPEKKLAAIKMLHSVLEKSERMLVAMDETFWQRLWCVWEFAAFARSGGGIGAARMRFLSPERDAVIVSMCVPWMLMSLFSSVYLNFFSALVKSSLVQRSVIPAGCMVLISPLVVPLACKYVLVSQKISTTLKEFRLEKAFCSDPEDHIFISTKIHVWFGNVTAFENFVRNDLHAIVTEQAFAHLRSRARWHKRIAIDLLLGVVGVVVDRFPGRLSPTFGQMGNLHVERHELFVNIALCLACVVVWAVVPYSKIPHCLRSADREGGIEMNGIAL